MSRIPEIYYDFCIEPQCIAEWRPLTAAERTHIPPQWPAITHKPISRTKKPVKRRHIRYVRAASCVVAAAVIHGALLKVQGMQTDSLTLVGEIKVMDVLTVPPFLLFFLPTIYFLCLLLLIHPCPPGTNLLVFTSCEKSEVQTF